MMQSAPASHASRTAMPFVGGAIVVASVLIVAVELAARASDLPTGIDDSSLYLFGFKILGALLAGHVVSAMVCERFEVRPLAPALSALSGFGAMSLLLIVLMSVGALLGAFGSVALAFAAGALATTAAITVQQLTTTKAPIA